MFGNLKFFFFTSKLFCPQRDSNLESLARCPTALPIELGMWIESEMFLN